MPQFLNIKASLFVFLLSKIHFKYFFVKNWQLNFFNFSDFLIINYLAKSEMMEKHQKYFLFLFRYYNSKEGSLLKIVHNIFSEEVNS